MKKSSTAKIQRKQEGQNLDWLRLGSRWYGSSQIVSTNKLQSMTALEGPFILSFVGHLYGFSLLKTLISLFLAIMYVTQNIFSSVAAFVIFVKQKKQTFNLMKAVCHVT